MTHCVFSILFIKVIEKQEQIAPETKQKVYKKKYGSKSCDNTKTKRERTRVRLETRLQVQNSWQILHRRATKEALSQPDENEFGPVTMASSLKCVIAI